MRVRGGVLQVLPGVNVRECERERCESATSDDGDDGGGGSGTADAKLKPRTPHRDVGKSVFSL